MSSRLREAIAEWGRLRAKLEAALNRKEKDRLAIEEILGDCRTEWRRR
jgi:hypothetical protein